MDGKQRASLDKEQRIRSIMKGDQTIQRKDAIEIFYNEVCCQMCNKSGGIIKRIQQHQQKGSNNSSDS